MPKKVIKSKIDRHPIFLALLAGVVIGLVVILVINMSILARNRFSQNQKLVSDNIHVSLGSMTYDFSGEKAIKRQDQTVKDLESFLNILGERDYDPEHCPSIYYNVIVTNKTEDQVLLGYGCYTDSGRMFAVKSGDEWHTISPTDHFDMLGIPGCDYLEENIISNDIAPVCFVEPEASSNDSLTYLIR